MKRAMTFGSIARAGVFVATAFGAVCGRELAAQAIGTRADSIGIVHALWRAATDSKPTDLSGHVRWLWTPSFDNAPGAVPLSAAVRAALSALDIPAFERRPTGDDTVVFYISGWITNANDVSLSVRAAMTYVQATRAGLCRYGWDNASSFRVTRSATGWTAVRQGPVMAGDNGCRLIRPDSGVPHALRP